MLLLDAAPGRPRQSRSQFFEFGELPRRYPPRVRESPVSETNAPSLDLTAPFMHGLKALKYQPLLYNKRGLMLAAS
jgi:hypothetical protein